MIKTDKPILVTGSAGFIGFHLCKRLLEEGYSVVGIDNLNDYYDVKLKLDRTAILKKFGTYAFEKIDLADEPGLKKMFGAIGFEYVVNMAAQAGVRYSLSNPFAYLHSNVNSFLNVLERCREGGVHHLVYASSSSVYGANTDMPFNVERPANHPMTLYAATKKSNEMMAHAYSSGFDLPTTGLRFFNAYGPWGRPDSALFIFVENILNKKPISVNNFGDMKRDFTYIDDIIEGVFRVIGHVATPDEQWSSDHPNPGTSYAPFRIYNIGNNTPVNLMDFVQIIEDQLGMRAEINFAPMQLGDIPNSHSESPQLVELTGYKPITSAERGIKMFIKWYKEYYKI